MSFQAIIYVNKLLVETRRGILSLKYYVGRQFFSLSMTEIYISNFLFCFECKWNLLILCSTTFLNSFDSESVFLSTLAKPEFKLEMLAGSCTAWSMEFSLMAKCRATRPSAEETIPSTRFSARLERENTFLALCSLTWNQLLSVSKRALCISHRNK